jgi:hypothetical protein
MALMKNLLVTLLFFTVLPACGDFDFQGQDLRLEHDIEANALELELVCHGVMANAAHSPESPMTRGHHEARDLKRARTAVMGIAEGRRFFMIGVPILPGAVEETA